MRHQAALSGASWDKYLGGSFGAGWCAVLHASFSISCLAIKFLGLKAPGELENDLLGYRRFQSRCNMHPAYGCTFGVVVHVGNGSSE